MQMWVMFTLNIPFIAPWFIAAHYTEKNSFGKLLRENLFFVIPGLSMEWLAVDSA